MRVLLDTGVFIHSEFAEDAIRHVSVRWGNRNQVLVVHVTGRKAPDKNANYQKQIEALFTVGRLIREGQMEAYDYNEIAFERIRGEIGGLSSGVLNALRGCTIKRCPSAIERSRFRQTTDFTDLISKGGNKDRKPGIAIGEANQIAFFEWLYGLKKEHVDGLVKHAAQIGLTAFEIESLRRITWFQYLCQRSQGSEKYPSSENYPDVFHLWTAERNGLDAVLTLETGLPNLVSRVRNEKVRRVEVRTEVLRPLELLKKLGIDQPDPVPTE